MGWSWRLAVWLFTFLLASAAGIGTARAGDLEDAAAAIQAKDYDKALRLLRPDAQSGNAASQNNLGFLYQNGYGVARNYEEALKWYRLSAAQGYALARSNLGFMHQSGQGVAQNYEEALRLYRLAAAQGHPSGQRNLGGMYRYGYGVAQSFDEALRWYRLAASREDAQARNNIGVFYHHGHGVAQNHEEAVKWYRLAAAQGYAWAQSNLGSMYLNGYGVAKDFDEALKLFKLASAQGNSGGQSNMGFVHEMGRGVPKDLQEAGRWYRLAAAQGNDFAKGRLESLGLNKGAPEQRTAAASAASGQQVATAPDAAARKDVAPVQTASDGKAAVDAENMRLDLERQRAELEREKLAFEQQKLAVAKLAAAREAGAAAPAAPPVARKVALVIGNALYRDSPLKNPVNDARAISQKLRAFGFEVLLKENLKSREIGGVMAEFASRITPGSEAIFFYAGHGVQLRGENFFPTVDAEMKTEFDMPTQSISLNRILDLMQDRKAGLSLVLLDSCRNNPFLLASRSFGRGLAPVNAASGTLLSYATRPGSVAADGVGVNGVYTTSLLRHIDTPNLPVEMLLKRIAGEVKKETKGAQEPWTEGNIEGDFMFVRK